jgi:phosphoribosylglycinamide formyltransferase-1
MNLVVLISGSGSNLQAILDHAAGPDKALYRVAAVLSNRADAFGLERARGAGIPAEVLDHRAFSEREAYDAALMDKINSYSPDLVVLAGFMRILTPAFVRHYQGRLLNIHPSLLPAFRGLHTHYRALEARVAEHGATVHFVTDELDAGPIILQARVPVLPNDTPEILAARVLAQEHQIYPQAIRWFAQGRLQLIQGRAWLDNKPIAA